jgi:hypothetical protein
MPKGKNQLLSSIPKIIFYNPMENSKNFFMQERKKYYKHQDAPQMWLKKVLVNYYGWNVDVVYLTQ